jgi:hypothetical protein
MYTLVIAEARENKGSLASGEDGGLILDQGGVARWPAMVAWSGEVDGGLG